MTVTVLPHTQCAKHILPYRQGAKQFLYPPTKINNMNSLDKVLQDHGSVFFSLFPFAGNSLNIPGLWGGGELWGTGVPHYVFILQRQNSDTEDLFRKSYFPTKEHGLITLIVEQLLPGQSYDLIPLPDLLRRIRDVLGLCGHRVMVPADGKMMTVMEIQ